MVELTGNLSYPRLETDWTWPSPASIPVKSEEIAEHTLHSVVSIEISSSSHTHSRV